MRPLTTRKGNTEMSSTMLQQPVLIRNTQTGPTVFSDEKTGAEYEWGGAGDPLGTDVQAVDIDLLKNHNFLRNLGRGTFEVESAPPEILENLAAHLNSPQLQRQGAAWRAKQAAAAQGAIEVVDHAEDNDLVFDITATGGLARRPESVR